MKANDIILHLMENVPKYTDAFSSYLKPTSVSVGVNTVTFNKAAHGLVNGQYVSVTESSWLNPISTIEEVDGVIQFTTTEENDLSYGWHEQVYLSSAEDPTVDGWYDLSATPDCLTFQIASFPDITLEDVMLHEFREVGINGLYQVTVGSTSAFSITTEVNPVDIGLTLDPASVKVHYNIRISGAATIERCVEAYEMQATDDLLWAYVILGANTINKDRYANSDADMEQGGQNEWNGLYLSPFSIYVFRSVGNEIAGRGARDAIEDIRPALFHAILGTFFETGFENQADSAVAPRNDGPWEYRKAYYVHQFEFMQTAQIAQQDTLYEARTCLWRKLAFDMMNTATDNGEVIASAEVNLNTFES